MSEDDIGTSRRRILSTTAAGMAALVIPGIATANPGNERGRGRSSGRGVGNTGPPKGVPGRNPPGIKVSQQGLELAVPVEEFASGDPGEVPGIPDRAEPISQEAVEAAVEGVNDGIQDDDLEISETGTGFALEVNGRGRRSENRGVAT